MNINAEEKARQIIADIANINFSNLIKSTQGDEFVQFNEKKVANYSLHYEIITAQGRADNNNLDRLFVEYHVENYGLKRSANEEFIEKLKQIFKKYNINTYWLSNESGRIKPMAQGFSVCYNTNGISANDEEPVPKLVAQLNDFFVKVDKEISKFLFCESLLSKLELLKKSKQLILTGAPGTGKTYTAIKMAEELIKRKGGLWAKVQFHPGYDYSDFIIGLKPKVINNQVTFDWKDGIFKKFSDEALYERKNAEKENKDAKPYIFIIDEINRADLGRVFGEVFSLLEEEYRYPNNEKGITLSNGKNFILPDNLYIIGTMNDIDRSVESMDFALRRRFSWHEVKAEDSKHIIDAKKDDVFKITNEKHREALKKVMTELNKFIGSVDNKNAETLTIDMQQISLHLGDEYQLGGAYFLNFAKYQNEENPWEKLWDNHIAIILNEYLRGRKDRQTIISTLKDKCFAILGDNK